MPKARRRAVVAVLGPDGAGKGTTIRGVVTASAEPIKVTYLGVPRRHDRAGRHPRGGPEGSPLPPPAPPSGLLRTARECAFVLRRALRSGWLLAGAYKAARRGRLVLCDRHPIEVLAIRPRRTPLASRLERFIAQHVLPWPDAVVVLDAPGQLLFDRKREHSPERLESWRRRYLEMFGGGGATVISTEGPAEESIAALLRVVREARVP